METLDSFVTTKAPKKSPLISWMVFLVLATVCGVYICSIYLQHQTNTPSRSLKIKIFNPSCQLSGIEQSEISYVHFPKPETFNREECECNPVRYFAIVSMQRSGSGWFETLLNSHINVSSNGELLGSRSRRTNVSLIFETLDKVYNLDWFTSASKNECTAAVGFKWMLNQGLMQYHEDIANYFKENGIYVLFLFRKNLLRRMISLLANMYDKEAKLLNGTHKSHVHSSDEAQVLAKYKPTINITNLIPELRKVEKMVNKAIGYFNTTPYVVLYYEDVVNNRTKLKEVQEFLRLPVRNLTSNQVKIHKGNLSKQIQNWDEVSEALKGSSYEGLLESD